MSKLLTYFTSLSILLNKSNDYNSYMELFTNLIFNALIRYALNTYSIDIPIVKEYNPCIIGARYHFCTWHRNGYLVSKQKRSHLYDYSNEAKGKTRIYR